ncbi:MAG: plasmid mobilization relaxosome protein MobC [Cyanobacteria bacterium J06627_28]
MTEPATPKTSKRRKHYVKLSFNDTEFERVTALAEQAGRKPATYCRLKALEQDAQLTHWLPELREVHRDLGPIGNNLNQTVRHLNRGHQLEESLALQLEAALQETRNELRRVQQLLQP